jgi:hypothetical protein
MLCSRNPSLPPASQLQWHLQPAAHAARERCQHEAHAHTYTHNGQTAGRQLPTQPSQSTTARSAPYTYKKRQCSYSKREATANQATTRQDCKHRHSSCKAIRQNTQVDAGHNKSTRCCVTQEPTVPERSGPQRQLNPPAKNPTHICHMPVTRAGIAAVALQDPAHLLPTVYTPKPCCLHTAPHPPRQTRTHRAASAAKQRHTQHNVEQTASLPSPPTAQHKAHRTHPRTPPDGDMSPATSWSCCLPTTSSQEFHVSPAMHTHLAFTRSTSGRLMTTATCALHLPDTRVWRRPASRMKHAASCCCLVPTAPAAPGAGPTPHSRLVPLRLSHTAEPGRAPGFELQSNDYSK